MKQRDQVRLPVVVRAVDGSEQEINERMKTVRDAEDELEQVEMCCELSFPLTPSLQRKVEVQAEQQRVKIKTEELDKRERDLQDLQAKLDERVNRIEEMRQREGVRVEESKQEVLSLWLGSSG
eukprot:180826-Hanusia_phi.AAC.10